MDLPLNMRQSEAQWNATISEMVAFGANITPQEQAFWPALTGTRFHFSSQPQ
jgi:hypothetical protein